MKIPTNDSVHGDRQIANRVMRYHTWPVIHRQSIGEHSNRVLQIYVEIFGLPRSEVLYYISHHDSGEQFSGDIPFGGKRVVPGLGGAINAAEQKGLQKLSITMPVLSPDEFEKMKMCDALEMWEFGSVEYVMGNAYGLIVAKNALHAALERAKNSENLTSELRSWISKQGRTHND